MVLTGATAKSDAMVMAAVKFGAMPTTMVMALTGATPMAKSSASATVTAMANMNTGVTAMKLMGETATALPGETAMGKWGETVMVKSGATAMARTGAAMAIASVPPSGSESVENLVTPANSLAVVNDSNTSSIIPTVLDRQLETPTASSSTQDDHQRSVVIGVGDYIKSFCNVATKFEAFKACRSKA